MQDKREQLKKEYSKKEHSKKVQKKEDGKFSVKQDNGKKDFAKKDYGKRTLKSETIKQSGSKEKAAVVQKEAVSKNRQKSEFPKGQFCPHFTKCGSCKYLDVTYQQQLAVKEKFVADLMKKYCKCQPIIGMDDPFHYRHKVHAVFGLDRKKNPISGVYEEKSHRILPVDSCLIEDEKADAIVGTVRDLLKSFKIKVVEYDPDTGKKLREGEDLKDGFEEVHIPADVRVCAYYLNNRDPARWREHPKEDEDAVMGLVAYPDMAVLEDPAEEGSVTGGDEG